MHNNLLQTICAHKILQPKEKIERLKIWACHIFEQKMEEVRDKILIVKIGENPGGIKKYKVWKKKYEQTKIAK